MSHPVRPPSQLIRPLTVPDRLAFILRQWQEGAEPNTCSILEQHPEWQTDKPFVQDLVLEEFCLRKERGETLEVEEFTARFPLYQTTLRRMLAAQQFLEENNELLDGTTPTRWPEVGEHVGDLTLVKELGRGAFARVFLAKEATTGNRLVVAKLSFDGQHEAQTLGPLDHPHIVSVLSASIDKATGLSVVRMPYHGRATLEDLLDKAYSDNRAPSSRSARGILDIARCDDWLAQAPSSEFATGTFEDGIVRLVGQLAEALAFLHSRGVCHRDIKPTNVLLNPQGRALLLDFNLSADGSLPPGRLGGTLPYMAPEQLRAMSDSRQPAPGSAADVFALGVIAYELLTGRHPFGPVPAAAPVRDLADLLVVRHLQGPPSLRNFNGHVGRSFAATLTRCLAAKPDDRPSALELVHTVKEYFSFSRRCGRWIRQRPLVAATALAMVAGLSLGAVEFAKTLLPAPVPLISQSEPEKLYARGRDLLERDDRVSAYDAFRELNSRSPDARAMACMAYLDAKEKNHQQAIDLADKAMERGMNKNARVYNNRGYSHMMLHESAQKSKDARRSASAYDSALADFDEAIRLDPDLQAPRYNRGKLALRRSLSDTSWEIPEQAFDDMRKALELGPATRALAFDTARLFAQGAKQRPKLRDEILTHLVKAVELGQDPQVLTREPLFKSLLGEEGFKKLLDAKPAAQLVTREVQLLDPMPTTGSVATR